MTSLLPLRHRIWPLAAVFFGAPISAEYLSAYLSLNGNPALMLLGLLIFGPLYGGAALLIQEIAVRAGLGWRGVLLLAAGFGLAMPGVIDLALFGTHRSDFAAWEQMRLPTLIGPLGISAYTTLAWVSGHVLMSIAAPLALLDALAPAQRGRPLLGRFGIGVAATLFVLVAIVVHADGRDAYGYTPNLVQVACVLAVVAILVALAFTPLGRPTRYPVAAERISPWILLPAGVIGMICIDVVPPTWPGVAILLALFVAISVVIARLARTRVWTAYEIATIAAGAVIGRALIGFLTPLPEGVSTAAKYATSTGMLALVAVLTWLVLRSGSVRRRRLDSARLG